MNESTGTTNTLEGSACASLRDRRKAQRRRPPECEAHSPERERVRSSRVVPTIRADKYRTSPGQQVMGSRVGSTCSESRVASITTDQQLDTATVGQWGVLVVRPGPR